MKNLVTLFCGALFGLGLVVSGMTDTLKVQGFLDFFGAWDATLVFVMGGAIIPMFIAWRIAAAREKSMLGEMIPPAPKPGLDRSLITGALLFGAGWGLSGFCPGPALASSTFGGIGGLTFLAAMLAGMAIAPPVIRAFKAAP
ncbi:MAG: hypothetical protein IME92_02475 [Proteobacteria bacterium]|nr:hypothetical protein [Pseudomonadota bacterium]